MTSRTTSECLPASARSAPGIATMDRLDLKTQRLEILRHQLAQRHVVVNDQYLVHCLWFTSTESLSSECAVEVSTTTR